MRITEADARALLKAVGWNQKIVDEFSVARLKAKLEKFTDFVDAGKKPKDKNLGKLFDAVMAACDDADEGVEILVGKAAAAAAAKKPVPVAVGKAGKKKAVVEEPEEEDDDADEEEEEGDGDSEEDDGDEEAAEDEADGDEDAEDAEDEAGEEDEDDESGEDSEEDSEAEEEDEIRVGSQVEWEYKGKTLCGEVTKIRLKGVKKPLATVKDKHNKEHFVALADLVRQEVEDEDNEFSLVGDEEEEEVEVEEEDASDDEESEDADEDADDEDDTDSDEESEEEEDDMEPVATKKPAPAKKPAGKPAAKPQPAAAKKTAPAAPGKKAAPFKGAGGDGKPGVIDSIVEFLGRATEQKPMTKPQIVAMVLKRFPDKQESAVESTVGQNVPTKLRLTRGLDIRKNERGYWIKQKKAK